MKKFITSLIVLVTLSASAQCNQHVFSSVGADKWTNFEYQDCDSAMHSFGLPNYPSCIQVVCPGDLDGDGVVAVEDLLILLSSYGVPCVD